MLLCTGLFIALIASQSGTPADELQWWKGNLHTHSLWSDGNDFPEMIAAWYKDNGYHFLALSDHNVLSAGDRWMPRSEVERRAGADAIAACTAQFGERWVEQREIDNSPHIRLKPLAEFRGLLEEPNRFLMIQSEEISDSFARLPIHINAANIQNLIPPQHGDSVADTIRNNLRAVIEQEEATGEPILAHLNHPNFGWAITAEDMAHVLEEHFFEVFNGHTGTNDSGDDARAGTEEMWDIANTLRLATLDAPPLFALAVDDSHHYHGRNTVAQPGRGWIMVRASELSPRAIIEAMRAGDFYASTGVVLNDVRFESDRLSIVIEPQPATSYTTYFIGTRRGFNDAATDRKNPDGTPIRTTRAYSDDIGEVFASALGTEPSYTVQGDELYVRALVVANRAHPDPALAGEQQKAWTQPVGWRTQLGHSDALRVMTFNIRYDNTADGKHAWMHRRDRVAELIQSHMPDIIGLQEALPSQVAFLTEALPDHAFYGVGRNADGGGEATPIAWRRDRFAEIERGVWWLSEDPETPGSRGWDAALPRIATFVRLRDMRSQEQLLVVCTHFDHRGEEARSQSARQLADRLRVEPRVVLLGDFNAQPASAPHNTLTSVFDDTAGDSVAPTWTGWDGEPDPGRRIDWILENGFTVHSYAVPQWADPSRPESDHLPVVVELVVE